MLSGTPFLSCSPPPPARTLSEVGHDGLIGYDTSLSLLDGSTQNSPRRQARDTGNNPTDRANAATNGL